ncbi:hypothetical protein M23134_05837 [Microscilla marina ATCC 23134]|uniref:Uncharacterized protein n=2 Tax=Microscilla marina TaxID=1027 RepID=A1ZXI7_MICM2|nr:hypothetical protein M23134_05837 [Microscilla marina ATCC 23134]
MIYKLGIFILLFCLKAMVVQGQGNPKISFNIQEIKRVSWLEKDGKKEDTLVRLIAKVTFKSLDKDTLRFIWDHRALENKIMDSHEVLLRKNTKGKFNNSVGITQILDKSTILVENQSNELCFLGDISCLKETIYFGGHYDCEQDCLEQVSILPKQEKRIRDISLILNFLRKNKNDTKVRLHYLFKPTEKQMLEGYDSLRLVSNWIKI